MTWDLLRRRGGVTVGGSPRLRIVGIPGAGVGVECFGDLWSELGDLGTTATANLPGRGRRFNEPTPTGLLGYASDVVESAGPWDVPFTLVGHSAGALVAYEAARLLAQRGHMPELVVVLAHRAPHVKLRDPKWSELPDGDLVREMARLGGLPASIRAEAELLHIALPIVRADCRALENYSFAGPPERAFPIMALGGLADPAVSAEEIEAWQFHSRSPFDHGFVRGGHFFFMDEPRSVADRICRRLGTLAPRLLERPINGYGS